MEVLLALSLLAGGVVLGVSGAVLVLRLLHAGRIAGLVAERDLLRERIVDLEACVSEDAQTAAVLAPLRDALGRVERQVGVLERDRTEQFTALGERLAAVAESTTALGSQTSRLAGALNSSSVRGAWGEVQLRRVLEHAGMLRHCDFDEQVRCVTAEDAAVRPDVVVRLPGEKMLVVDAKAPMTAFLGAHAESLDPVTQAQLLRAHASALRGHVDSLAAKAYWSAFPTSPELVVCFVPSEAMLAAALAADPALFDHAMSRRVALASPATLLALLRTVAFAWQQDALAAGARELLELGRTLYARLGSLGGHTARLGSTLQRSVEAYNALVGSLETRVLVTARRIHELGLSDKTLPDVSPVTLAPRPLSAVELIDAQFHTVMAGADAREELRLPEVG